MPVQLKMAVQQVNDGYLEITNAPGEEKLTALTDAEGRYCAASADVKQLIPSGAAITTLKSDPAQTVCRVDQIVTHRSIIWIQLFSGKSGGGTFEFKHYRRDGRRLCGARTRIPLGYKRDDGCGYCGDCLELLRGRFFRFRRGR